MFNAHVAIKSIATWEQQFRTRARRRRVVINAGTGPGVGRLPRGPRSEESA
jgi:hypothetical protein